LIRFAQNVHSRLGLPVDRSLIEINWRSIAITLTTPE
jgi:hypothetical protein